ncbi:MAG: GNAT family N-acetyltransferase [Rhodospirillales bacterium]|nr:GNAT family N-acetyltransferase [Rhodospirillales bacterium]
MTINVLDNPVWHALAGPHRQHALGRGLARHYPRDIAPFSAIAEPSAAAYADLAADLPVGTEARLFRPQTEPLPDGWEETNRFALLQMVASRQPEQGGSPVTVLSHADAAAMLDLVAATEPGPFGKRTPLLGRYVGIRHGDRLVAMAGERLRVPDHVELSAICVHPEARGKGYGATLTRELMRRAFAQGERPFLHVRPDNAAAVALYRGLGFETRRELVVLWRRPI